VIVVRGTAVRLVGGFGVLIGVLLMVGAGAHHSVVARAAHVVAGPHLGRPQIAMLGLATLAVSRGIGGRRRLALWTAWLALGVGLVLAVPHDPARVAALGGLIVALVAVREEFRAQPDPRRLRLAAQVGGTVLGLVVAGTAYQLVVRREPPGSVGHALVEGLATTTSPTGVLSLLLTGGVVAMLLLALAPAPAPDPGSSHERGHVAMLVAHADADSLAPFTTRQDKSYVFSPDQRAAIGYRVVLGTAVASGDPVGAGASGPDAIAAFVDLCHRSGWRPAVLGASDALLPSWREYGLRGFTIGDEAVLDVASFSLDSRRMRNVRQAVARTHHAGVTVHIAAMTPSLSEKLRPVLEHWLDGGRMRGFAMNLDQLLSVRRDCVIATAYDHTGEPVAFARFAVSAGGRILTLDVAPRRRDAPNGVVERLIIEAMEYARASGAREVSLNFAGMRRVFEAGGVAGRVGVGLLRAFDRWIELGPLYRFCAKFHPIWRSRSILLPGWTGIPMVGAAALLAELRPSPVPAPRPAAVEPDPAEDPLAAES
jgi:lysyl-tRNA synthetase class 2